MNQEQAKFETSHSEKLTIEATGGTNRESTINVVWILGKENNYTEAGK